MTAFERLQKSLARALVKEALTNNPFILQAPFSIEVDENELIAIMFRGKPHARFKTPTIDSLSDQELDFMVHHELLHAVCSVMERPQYTMKVDSQWAAALDYLNAVFLAKDSTKH